MEKKQFDHRPRRVALFVTCMVDMMYPDVGMATAELLERHGIEVFFPDEQTCCGQPAFNAGYRDEARMLAQRFVNVFEPLLHNGMVDAVVAPSGSCVAMTTHFYQTLFAENPNDPYVLRTERLAAATFELSEFLVDVLGVTDVDARIVGSQEAHSGQLSDNKMRGAHPPVKMAYHACCHLLRELGVDEQPRLLLDSVQGATTVALEGSEECCGFGGLFSIKNPGISTAIGDRKVKNIGQSGADVVAMCDVSCMTHINGLLEKQGKEPRAVHIAEVLNQQMDGGVIDGDDAAAVETPMDQPPARPKTALEPSQGQKSSAGQPILPKATPPKRAKSKAKPEESRPRRWQDY